MFDNLLNMGISEDILTKMIQLNGEALIEDLNANYENAFKIISALKAIKVNDIDSILINKLDLFFMDYDEFISKLKDKNLREISEKINNEGGFAIDEIFFEE